MAVSYYQTQLTKVNTLVEDAAKAGNHLLMRDLLFQRRKLKKKLLEEEIEGLQAKLAECNQRLTNALSLKHTRLAQELYAKREKVIYELNSRRDALRSSYL